MNSEVETILNELREKKRKEDEEKAIREKYAEELRINAENSRKEKLSNFIQLNKNKWEAEERFCEENGTGIRYSYLSCPVCNQSIYERSISCKNTKIPYDIFLSNQLGNIKCQSCKDIIIARNKFYEERLNAEESRKQAEEARKREEQVKRNEEEQKKKIQEKIAIDNIRIKENCDNAYLKHTFTGFVYGKPDLQMLYLDKSNVWHHYEYTWYGENYKPCTKGINNELKNYYAEGKLPFITICPDCNEPMKIEYRTVHAECSHHIYSDFTEVCCPKGHYKYDSKEGKHYKWKKDPPRQPLLDSFGRNIDFRPEGLGGQWVFWDPTDPEGIRAEAERRKKHNEDIHKQIELLKTKLLPE